MWLARLLNIPYSLTVSTGWTPFPRYINEKVVRAASFCVVPTIEARDLVADLRGSDAGIHLVRTGVDLHDLTKRVEPPDASVSPLILAVGRLMRQKGFDVLVRACALLRSRCVAFRCQIVGGGPEHGALHHLIAELGLEEIVSLTGALPFDAIKPLFREATVLAMPSRITPHGRDGLPNAVVEALAVGVPVVASAVAAIPDLIIDGQTGMLIAPDEPAQLADALETMLANPALRQRLADAGCAKVRREFDIVATVGQIEGLIQATADALLH
jgi:glycosyltransferase involved in cell wall biosynthesis